MSTPRNPQRGTPRSYAELEKLMGFGGLRSFLNFQSIDRVRMFDDFVGDTINLDNYALADSGGAAVADFAIAVAENGTIAGATGSTSNGSISLITPIIYTAARNAACECRLKMGAAASNYNLEVGFIDAVPGTNGSGVSDVDTPAATFADGAVLQIDTSQTITGLAFVTKGSAASQVTTATTIAAPAPTVLTAGTYMTVRIELRGTQAYCFLNGIPAAHHDTTVAGAIGTVPLGFWIYARTRTGTTKTITVDYIDVWQDRV